MNGSCLCGSIHIETATQQAAHVCHCGMCQRWSAGPNIMVQCGSEVQFTGITPSTYASSEWAERGFCPKCGNHLFYRLLANNTYFLPAGLFPDVDFKVAVQLYIDHKPDYYALSNDTPTLTEAQVLAHLAPSAAT